MRVEWRGEWGEGPDLFCAIVALGVALPMDQVESLLQQIGKHRRANAPSTVSAEELDDLRALLRTEIMRARAECLECDA